MTEHEKARAWRKARGLSVRDLADRSGYSIEAIYKFERGLSSTKGKTTVEPWVWQRYRNICAGIDAQLRSGANFDWGK